MTNTEVLQSIQEIATLMHTFSDDENELQRLADRMRARLDQLETQL